MTATISDYALRRTVSPEVAKAIQERKGLPVLDLAAYLDGSEEALEQLAADVRAIQLDLGFFAIKNHGVSQDVIDEAFAQLPNLFELDDEIKMKYRTGYHHQGFIPPKSLLLQSKVIQEKIGLNTKRDAVLTWTFMRERDADDPRVKAGHRHRGLNQWPEGLPRVREALLRYQRDMEALALKLLPVYARALELPADFFDRSFREPEYYQACTYYRPMTLEEGQYMLAPHSDGSFLTLLPISPIPALEVMLPERTWMPVHYQPGVLIVNTGQVLNRWSNDRFIATPHRVNVPTQERYALPFFFYPDDDALIEAVPTCVRPGEPSRYEPIRFHDWFNRYIDEIYHYDKTYRAPTTAAA
jgi:isopenicillin N synthase-like dioxygenase